MHRPPDQNLQQPHYEDVVAEVYQFLHERILFTQTAGIARERIVIDPGFDSKSLVHNLSLLRYLDKFSDLGIPLLVGMSRKSMLGAITGHGVDGRIHASVAAALLAVLKGARVVRVHDVRATVDALRVLNAVREMDL